ncbi:hypothetical protein GCM10022225_78900 [Plantactinospora mayteni]|uniref:SCP2 domain-containing protein n=1 Tax=Plantactinospora mayteni TaxID=566021 RepID=A0ABQ4F2X0_9ACTN|nr:SCP2 sterol-binding domain-containing protein [Plantactinospora mayteni]GIH01260.1 hypothetical protein Pma05_78320 [Plantactinospora mayteni]
MADPVVEFFDGLERAESTVLPVRVNGTARFDLNQDGETDHWYVAIQEGAVSVSHEMRDADVVLNAERGFFERLVTGRANLFASLLRRDFTVEGNLQLLMPIERILPQPPGAHDPRAFAPGRNDRT